MTAGDKNISILPGLSITRFWGRNSALFPMPKSMFFPQFQTKNPSLTKKNYFFFFLGGGGGGVLHLYSIKYKFWRLNLIVKLLTITLYIKKKGKFNYWNQSSNGNVIHKVKTPLIFPIPWAPAPFPKRGVRALIALVLQDEWLIIFTRPANTYTCPLKAYAIKNIRE